MPDYLVRFVQMHESFRQAELQALADVAEVPIEFVKYDDEVGLCDAFSLLRGLSLDHFSHRAEIPEPPV